MAPFTYATEWFAKKVAGHDTVTSVEALPTGQVKLERELKWDGKTLPSITVTPIRTDRADVSVVKEILAVSVPTVILLVPKRSHYDWDARELAEESGTTLHTFRELYTFMGERDPRPFVDKRVSYTVERLGQHSAVSSLAMICEASMRLSRHAGMSELVVAVDYQYEFSEEAVVQAIEHHPDASVIVNANPNGGSTEAALTHAKHAGVTIFGVSELMGALNYDGEQFRNYNPRHRRD
jgi:hypothetical protein